MLLPYQDPAITIRILSHSPHHTVAKCNGSTSNCPTIPPHPLFALLPRSMMLCHSPGNITLVAVLGILLVILPVLILSQEAALRGPGPPSGPAVLEFDAPLIDDSAGFPALQVNSACVQYHIFSAVLTWRLSRMQRVEVSPRCAAVTLFLSGAIGSGAASALSPKLFNMLQLGSGMNDEMFERNWAASRELFSKRKLHAVLLSVANGDESVTMTGLALGSAGVQCVQTICSAVDTVEAGSLADTTIAGVQKVVAVEGAHHLECPAFRTLVLFG